MNYSNEISNFLDNGKFDGIISFNDDQAYELYKQIHASERLLSEIEWDKIKNMVEYAKTLNDISFLRFWKMISAGNTRNTVRFHSLTRDRIVSAIMNREAHKECMYDFGPDTNAYKLREQEMKQLLAQVEAGKNKQING